MAEFGDPSLKQRCLPQRGKRIVPQRCSLPGIRCQCLRILRIEPTRRPNSVGPGDRFSRMRTVIRPNPCTYFQTFLRSMRLRGTRCLITAEGTQTPTCPSSRMRFMIAASSPNTNASPTRPKSGSKGYCFITDSRKTMFAPKTCSPWLNGRSSSASDRSGNNAFSYFRNQSGGSASYQGSTRPPKSWRPARHSPLARIPPANSRRPKRHHPSTGATLPGPHRHAVSRVGLPLFWLKQPPEREFVRMPSDHFVGVVRRVVVDDQQFPVDAGRYAELAHFGQRLIE